MSVKEIEQSRYLKGNLTTLYPSEADIGKFGMGNLFAVAMSEMTVLGLWLERVTKTTKSFT